MVYPSITLFAVFDTCAGRFGMMTGAVFPPSEFGRGSIRRQMDEEYVEFEVAVFGSGSEISSWSRSN